MVRRIDILHVYYGSQGAGGLYLKEIYDSLQKCNYKQDVIVSYYFPFDFGKKVFFPFTDLIAKIKLGPIRKPIRLVELVFGLTYTILYCIVKRPRFVNYSLISSMYTDLIFLSILKLLNIKVTITCHDVVPFGENLSSVEQQIIIRRKIFNSVNYFIVHNDNSSYELYTIFNVPSEKIFTHNFPIMDLKKVVNLNEQVRKTYDFAFIGHLRMSKGLDILIAAWEQYIVKFPNARLLICGNLPSGSTIDTKGLNGIDIQLGYLSDSDYLKSIMSSKNIVLPYKRGTNSGVLFNLLSLDVGIIYSSIPMFLESKILPKQGCFESENVRDLIYVMEKYMYNPILTSQLQLNDYNLLITNQIGEVYSKIL